MKSAIPLLTFMFLAAPAHGYGADLCGGITLPAGFAGCRTGAGGTLYLKAVREYGAQKATDRARSVGRIFAAGGIANTAPVLAVEGAGMGELWAPGPEGQAVKLDDWSDESIRVDQTSRRYGRFFGYLGGQLLSGGDYPSKGFNARLGTTLFKDRYDAAISYSHNSLNNTDNSGSSSLGFSGRALFNYTQHVGLNAGAQLDYSRSAGADGSWTPSVLGGLNFYLPQGSFDITITLDTEGSRSLLIGYTVYFSRN